MQGNSILGLTAEEILELIGLGDYRMSHAVAIANAVYKKRVEKFDGLTGLPRDLKKKLSSIGFPGFRKPVASEKSVDGSIKYLFREDDGREYETVYIPDGKRKTVCVSVQSGCRMGCSFCATATVGFSGSLSAGEIVNQILSVPEAGNVTNVVFMGMGEPMDNLEEVLKACTIITAEWGLALGSHNVTVSTVGITDGVRRFIESSTCNLTLSLFSPFSHERDKVIPAGKNNPFREILDLMKQPALRKRRRMSVAYVMIEGINDTQNHLEKLMELLINSDVRVNLLPYHSTGNDGFRSSSGERMQHFRHALNMSGISASVRKSRGADISAACGLLAGKFRGA